MQGTIAGSTFILLIIMVITRALLMKRAGIQAMHFGKIDKTDFLIPIFVLFYFYVVFAPLFNLPTVSIHKFFQSEVTAWVGVAFCLAGLSLFAWSMISFGNSFRVGIDENFPDKLITTGAFSVSRNPIYFAFALVLIGQFLVFPNWLLLVYLLAAIWLFNRQVLREEDFLKKHYGGEFSAYCKRVRRYL